jgi:hypothetical protein
MCDAVLKTVADDRWFDFTTYMGSIGCEAARDCVGNGRDDGADGSLLRGSWLAEMEVLRSPALKDPRAFRRTESESRGSES